MNGGALKDESTVLGEKVVESRGIGTGSSKRDEVHQEIIDFLTGEAKFGLKSETRCFFTILIFLTRLPAPTWVDLHPGYLMKGMAYFPLVGMVIGVVVSAVYDVARNTLGLPGDIAACISQAASFYMTICFHEDGLGDSADGIGGGWTKSQILKIMTDTRLGTYGCAALILFIVTKIHLLAHLGKSTWEIHSCTGAGPALIVGHMFARLTSPLLLRAHNYVEEVGPKSPYYSFMVQAKHLVSAPRVTFAIMSCCIVAWLAYGPLPTLLLLVVVGIASRVSGHWGEYYLDGVMGDFLGATICVTELLILTAIIVFSDESNLKYFWENIKVLSIMSPHDIKELMYTDQRMFSLLWLVLLFSIMKIWCANVGYSPELLRAELPTDPAAESNVTDLSSRRNQLEQSLKDSGISFLERYNRVREFIDDLAKPVGSLGTLEEWSARLAALQVSAFPKVEQVSSLIFAGDHGVAATKSNGGEECSSYPQAVTQKILQALEHNMAGASTLARANQVTMQHIVDLGVIGYTAPNEGFVSSSKFKLTKGTRNFCKDLAMTAEEVETCLEEGRKCVSKPIGTVHALVIGEVGIGNTTTASALLAALTGVGVDQLCDAGATLSRTVDQAVIVRKIEIVKKGLERHGLCLDNPSRALVCFGGAEICGMVGAMLEASVRNIPVLVDGFIVTTAAYVATLISPSVCRILFFATQSSERGQSVALDGIRKVALDASLPPLSAPALHMSLRMGEASAALVAVPLLKSAAALLDISTLNDVMALHSPPSTNGLSNESL